MVKMSLILVIYHCSNGGDGGGDEPPGKFKGGTTPKVLGVCNPSLGLVQPNKPTPSDPPLTWDIV